MEATPTFHAMTSRGSQWFKETFGLGIFFFNFEILKSTLIV